MRKSLEAITLAVLTFLFQMTWQAFHGDTPLPDKVPTHFDAVGNANAWGPPGTLWMLPVVAVVLYLIVTGISSLPTGARTAARFTPEGRLRFEALTRQMVSWLKLELVSLFACIQWFILSAIRQGSGGIPAAVMPVFLAAVFANVAWHTAAIFRAMRTGTNQ
jgi:uncharacterized membrane protein